MTLLNQQQIQKVTDAVDGLDPMQLAWMSGYFAGLATQASGVPLQAGAAAPAIAASAPVLPAEKITVLYGSQ